MPRSATTSDAFNAIAEPQRRAILGLLCRGEQPVNDLVRALGVNQPQVSKHLRVLKHVGLVTVRGDGQQRLYSLDARGLKPIHDWAKSFEQFWNARFNRLADYLDELQSPAKEVRLKPEGKVRLKPDPTTHPVRLKADTTDKKKEHSSERTRRRRRQHGGS